MPNPFQLHQSEPGVPGRDAGPGARATARLTAGPGDEDTAAAVVAEAVAIAMEAEATETAAAVVQIAAAVATAAATAARAADRARDARTFAAEKAAEIIAREAAQTAVQVQTRADAAALQVAQAAALAVEDMLAFGPKLDASQVAALVARTVLAAAEATADEAARAATVVAAAVAEAAAQMVAVNAASNDAYETEVSAAADALVGLTAATAWRVALDTEHHAAGAATAAREAATALEGTAAATRSAQDIDPAWSPAAGARTRPSSPARIKPSDHAKDYATFNGTLHELSGLALGDGSRGMVGLLSNVAELAAAAIPLAHGVGITWAEADRPDLIVATSDRFREVNSLDHTAQPGPGTTAMAAGRTMQSGSLGAETLWPEFGPVAALLGAHSVIAVPLAVGRDVFGSFNVYSGIRDGFDDRAVELAEGIAGAASRLLHDAQMLFESQRLVGDLQSALKTRAVIDQAIGIMMSRSGYSPREAFNGLRSVSQASNLKLHLVAERLVRDAVRRALSRQ